MYLTFIPHLLVWTILAVVLAIAEPLFLQTLMSVWASELCEAAWGPRAVQLIRAVTAVGISVTSQCLRHALTANTSILMIRTGHQTWKEENKRGCNFTFACFAFLKFLKGTHHSFSHLTHQHNLSLHHTGSSLVCSEYYYHSADGSPQS